MLYRNKRTGAVIETASALSGGDWEAVSAPAKEESETAAKPAAKPAKKAAKK